MTRKTCLLIFHVQRKHAIKVPRELVCRYTHMYVCISDWLCGGGISRFVGQRKFRSVVDFGWNLIVS